MAIRLPIDTTPPVVQEDDGSPAPHGTAHPVTHRVAGAIVKALAASGLTLTLNGEPVPLDRLGHARHVLPLLLWSIARSPLGETSEKRVFPDRPRLAFVPHQEDSSQDGPRTYVTVRVLNPHVSEEQMERWTQDLLQRLAVDARVPRTKGPQESWGTLGRVSLDEAQAMFLNGIVLPAFKRHGPHQEDAESLLDLALSAGPEIALNNEEVAQAVSDMRKTSEYPRQGLSCVEERSPDEVLAVIRTIIDDLDQRAAAHGSPVAVPLDPLPDLSDGFPLLTLPDARLAALHDQQRRAQALTDALGEVYVPALTIPGSCSYPTALDSVVDGWALRVKTLVKRSPYDTFLMADRLFARMSLGVNDRELRQLGGRALAPLLHRLADQGVLTQMPVRWRVALVQGLLHPAARDEAVIEALRVERDLSSRIDDDLLRASDGPDRFSMLAEPVRTPAASSSVAEIAVQAFPDPVLDEDEYEDEDEESDDVAETVASPAVAAPRSPVAGPVFEVEQQRFKPCRGTVGEFTNSARFKVLTDNTPLRTVGMDPWAWQDALDSTFPWMGELTARLVRRMSVQLAHNLPLHLPPIALLGEPGVGKTLYWVEAMRLLDHPFVVQGMAGANDSVTIKGTAAGWSNARPGLAATVMASLTCGNPVILLDELDKGHGSEINGNAQEALLPLLESATARQYRDDCLQLAVDTSHISWVMTLNDEERLDPALRSRVEVLDVKGPDWSNPEHLAAALTLGEKLAWNAWPPRLCTAETRLSDAQKHRLTTTRWTSLRSLGHAIRAMVEENLYHASIERVMDRRTTGAPFPTWRPEASGRP